MNIKLFLVLLLIIPFNVVFGQVEDEKKSNNIGINYFGELGFRPGFEVDYGFLFIEKGEAKENKKRYLSHQFYLRPSVAYYHFAHNSNNFLFSIKFNYQLRLINSTTLRYLSIEPYLKTGYLRKSYIGEIYQTSSQGFEEKKNAGSNAFTLGGGLDFGGYISKQIDWIFGMDYFIENTEDKLILHRFVAKIGTRIKLN